MREKERGGGGEGEEPSEMVVRGGWRRADCKGQGFGGLGFARCFHLKAETGEIGSGRFGINRFGLT